MSHIRTHVRTHIRAHTKECVRTYIHERTRAQTHIHIHVHVLIHIHMHIHAHIHVTKTGDSKVPSEITRLDDALREPAGTHSVSFGGPGINSEKHSLVYGHTVNSRKRLLLRFF